MKKLVIVMLSVWSLLLLVGCSSVDNMMDEVDSMNKQVDEVKEKAKEVKETVGQVADQLDDLKDSEIINDLEENMDVSQNGSGDQLQARADQEGISQKELEAVLEELTNLTAEKYGISRDDYIKQLQAENKSPLDEFARAADFMGISLVEYLDYEKQSSANMSDEEKGTMAAMGDALKEAADLNLGDLDDPAQAALEASGGAAGDKIVTGNYKDLGLYEVDKIIEEDTTSEGSSGMYMVSYESLASTESIIDYFRQLLIGTPDYFAYIAPGNIGGQISGTVNDAMVFVAIDNEDGDPITLVDYGYSGDFGMEVESSNSVETHTASDSANDPE